MTAPAEKWRRIPGYQAYEVSDYGRVRRDGGLLHPGGKKDRYVHVWLKGDDGQGRYIDVHLLVLTAFVGPRPRRSAVANHIDGDKRNNRLANLQWSTRSANARHALDVLGFQPPHGEQHCHVRYTDAQVAEARRLRKEGWLMKDIAARFGTNTGWVSNVVNNKARHGGHTSVP